MLKDFARELRRAQSDAERKLWYFLRNRQLSGYQFRRQHKIGPYIADFCCVAKNLIVEVDGGQHTLQKSRDQQRTDYLINKGYKVLRFWDDEVLRQTEVVLATIVQVLGPSPQPSPF